MSEEKAIPEAKIEGDSIRVHVTVDDYLTFPVSGWSVEDELFLSGVTYANVFQFMVERVTDWRITSSEGALIPFDRAELLRAIKLARAGVRGVLPKIPVQLEPAIMSAIWEALREIRKLPLGPA